MLEQAPDTMAEANLFSVLAALRAAAGDVEDGRRLLEHGRQIFDDLGNTLGLHTVWSPLCVEVELFAGRPEEAERVGRESFAVLAAASDRSYATTCAVHLAEILLDRGDAAAAEQFVGYADEHAVPSDVSVQFVRRATRARLLALSGDAESAEQLARDAVSIASHTDALRQRARTHAALARVLLAGGKKAEARREREEASRLLRQKGLAAASPLPLEA
jgi:ATP/maltotriose-dependent transcriptional regulator MalT